MKSQDLTRHEIGGQVHQIALPVTFTPFASKEPCTARCRFCSEALIHKGATGLSATLRPSADYGARLRRVFHELKGLEPGLSLSGLEATSNTEWFFDVLKAAKEHESNGGCFSEKVLYSNGTGLARETDPDLRILHALSDLELTRIEMSRHSPDHAKNSAIMQFREKVAVGDTKTFENTVKRANDQVPVKLVCVIQKQGVERIEEIEHYLRWAHSLGVDTVVFRELSRLHDLYKPNITSKYVEAASVPVEPLVDAALGSRDFSLEAITSGYYYWNMRFTWRKRIDAIFETSDYLLMKELHSSEVVFKMVFHANGNLCADWDPNTRVLMRV